MKSMKYTELQGYISDYKTSSKQMKKYIKSMDKLIESVNQLDMDEIADEIKIKIIHKKSSSLSKIIGKYAHSILFIKCMLYENTYGHSNMYDAYLKNSWFFYILK